MGGPFRLAVQAMKQLHPDVVASVQAKSLYNKEEEAVLGTITSVSDSLIWCPLRLEIMRPCLTPCRAASPNLMCSKTSWRGIPSHFTRGEHPKPSITIGCSWSSIISCLTSLVGAMTHPHLLINPSWRPSFLFPVYCSSTHATWWSCSELLWCWGYDQRRWFEVCSCFFSYLQIICYHLVYCQIFNF